MTVPFWILSFHRKIPAILTGMKKIRFSPTSPKSPLIQAMYAYAAEFKIPNIKFPIWPLAARTTQMTPETSAVTLIIFSIVYNFIDGAVFAK